MEKMERGEKNGWGGNREYKCTNHVHFEQCPTYSFKKTLNTWKTL